MQHGSRRSWALKLLVPVMAATAVLLAGCGVAVHTGVEAVGGSPNEGKIALQNYSCGSCHTIPGVPNAKGLVGPPLNNIAVRRIIAGKLPNTSDQLQYWIQNPQAVWPGNDMPDEHMSEQEARDMVAYLYTLK